MNFNNTDQASIASNMITALNVVEPDLDTSIGTTVRNIIDVCAEQISQAYIDSDIQTYQYVVDSLSGTSLDSFCANFGFQRFQAKNATGVATFTQQSSAIQLPTVTIPSGTLISTSTGVVFQTVATYSLIPVVGQNNSIDIPIQAVVGGGNGNVAAGTITAFNTPLNGINSVTNNLATSGGADAESDSAFRTRFKATVLRGFTGTAQSFLGAALENPSTVSANVMGSVVTHQEQITLNGSKVGTSVLTDVGYVYPYGAAMAVDLTNSTASTATGTLTLEGALNNGTAYTSVSLQATTSTSIAANTLLIFGTQTAVVTTTTVVGTSPTSVPIASFTPTQNFSTSYSVTWVLNSGDFFTQGVDFSLSTTPLVADPSTAPTVGTSTTGGLLAAGTYDYMWCYANYFGRTNITPANSITTTGTTSRNTISGWSNIDGEWVFIFGRSRMATTATNTLSTVAPTTSITTTATSAALWAGDQIVLTSGSHVQVFTVSANTAASSTTIPVDSQIANFAYAPGTIVSYPRFLQAQSSSIASWVDTNSVIPAGDIPVSNTTGVQVQVNGLSSNINASTTYQVQFDYIPASSRNSYPNILNAVDIYVNGSNPTSAAQSIPFYYGPMATSGPEIAPTGSFILGNTLSSGTTYTSITTTAPVTLPVGTWIHLGSQVAIVNTAATNTTTISIQPLTMTATYSSASTVYYDSFRFSGYSASPLYIHNFQRADSTLPTPGNRFIPLAFSPVITLPSSIISPTGSGTNNTSPATYVYETGYWMVNETDTKGMSNESLAGIEWLNGNVFGAGFNAGTSGSPTNVGATYPMSVDYSFNKVPLNVDNSIQTWRLLAQDIMVHQAYPALLNFSFVIVPASGALLSTIQSQVNAAISEVLTTVSFNQLLEASAVLSAVLGVTGVANARWATSSDNATNYAIQLVNSSGTVLQTFVSPTLTNVVSDIQFTNITYPSFNATYLYPVAQNTFVSGSTAFNQPL